MTIELLPLFAFAMWVSLLCFAVSVAGWLSDQPRFRVRIKRHESVPPMSHPICRYHGSCPTTWACDQTAIQKQRIAQLGG